MKSAFTYFCAINLSKSMGIECSKYKVGLFIIKYAPILMGLLMYIHTILSYNGIRLPIATTLAGSAIIPAVIIYAMSNMLKFCYIHKAFTLYALLVDICINYHTYFGFGKAVDIVQLIIIIVGTILFLLLCAKLKYYHYVCCKVRVTDLVKLQP